MHKLLILGAGNIGKLVAEWLADTKDYEILIVDVTLHKENNWRKIDNIKSIELDVTDEDEVIAIIKQYKAEAVVSCLPYYYNVAVARIANACNIHYFDLTEDTTVTTAVRHLSHHSDKAFVPQCGLAPGFVGMVANHIIQKFDKVDTVKLRVGAMPAHSSNALHYSISWSTEGLINQYGNTCYGIKNGEMVPLQPLNDLEKLFLDGIEYEAFNTSGGLGQLAEHYIEKVRNMNYKTLRYPGHCALMRVLMNDLKLNDDRETLKRILENALPHSTNDKVIIYVSVTGRKQNKLIEDTYLNTIRPMEILGDVRTAIQVCTAAGLCAVLDCVFENPGIYRGFVYQEHFPLKKILKNRFGRCLK